MDVSTLWRIIYSIPITDPRYLDAEQEQIIEDLLIRRFFFKEAENPGTLELEEMVGSGGLLDQLTEAENQLKENMGEILKLIHPKYRPKKPKTSKDGAKEKAPRSLVRAKVVKP